MVGSLSCVTKKSPHSYVIDVDGVQRNVHVNHLRKFHPSVVDASVNSCAMVFDTDNDFGEIVALEVGQPMVDNSDVNDVSKPEVRFDDSHVIFDGRLENNNLPSQIVSKSELTHLTLEQQSC